MSSYDYCKHVSTHLPTSQNFRSYEHNPLWTSFISYHSILGALQYLTTTTRPDLTSSINLSSQFMYLTFKIHEQAIKQVWRYVKGIINLEICNLSQSSLNLYGFYDADWAECPNTQAFHFRILHVSWFQLYLPACEKAAYGCSFKCQGWIPICGSRRLEINMDYFPFRDVHIYLKHPSTFFCDNLIAYLLKTSFYFLSW